MSNHRHQQSWILSRLSFSLICSILLSVPCKDFTEDHVEYIIIKVSEQSSEHMIVAKMASIVKNNKSVRNKIQDL